MSYGAGAVLSLGLPASLTQLNKLETLAINGLGGSVAVVDGIPGAEEGATEFPFSNWTTLSALVSPQAYAPQEGAWAGAAGGAASRAGQRGTWPHMHQKKARLPRLA